MEINKTYNENCLDTMSRMPDNFIDLTVTSPPYDNLRTYKDNIGLEWNFDKFMPIANELYRVTKDGGIVVWVVGDATIKGSETGTSFKQALYFKDVCGFRLHDTMIWHKTNPMPTQHNRYENSFECMFVFSKNKIKFNNILREPTKTVGAIRTKHRAARGSKDVSNNEGLYMTGETKIKHNIWDISVGKVKGLKHAAPFPEQLANDHIISWSNEGDLVYDPFMGSGTTAKMSLINKRNYIGSDLVEEYCDIEQERVKDLKLC